MPRRTEGLPDEYEAQQRALGSAIGTRIRMRRLQLKLSQEQVRVRMELENVYVSRARFSRIEIGHALLNAAEIIALVNVLQVSCERLLFGQDYRNDDDRE